MKVSDLLSNLDIGSSVAEFDTKLQTYFLETQIYKDFITDKYDIISGEKGTGKSAIYKVVKERYRSIPELSDVELLSGFNDSGNPIFQNLVHSDPLTEGQYITIWKSYFISLTGNFLLNICEGAFTDSARELDKVLNALGLRSKELSANTIFSQLSNVIRRVLTPKSAEVALSITDYGMPIVTPKIEFESIIPDDRANGLRIIHNEDAMNLVDKTISEIGIRIWIVLDRLDEAFAGFPKVEIPALRALLRAYLDMQAYENVKLKLFVRNDLFRKVIQGGFVNLSHVNAKKLQIQWYPEDLHSLLCKRIRECHAYLTLIGQDPSKVTDTDIFKSLFPAQVDMGDRKPPTWNWILSRIKDGNETYPPRNLIDIFNLSKTAQARREERDPREYTKDLHILEPDSIRKGYIALSDQRVQDTLLAESGEFYFHIEKFIDGKAEHTIQSLSDILHLDADEFRRILNELIAIGFIGQSGESFKVPILYRSGLNITQGKAYE